MEETKRTNYFKPSEFACPCCGETPVPVNEELLNALNAIREAWGGPIKVGSGYRCPGHNRAVGGEPDSQHLYGRAADIYPLEWPDEKDFSSFHDLCHKEWSLGTIHGLWVHPLRGFCHVDVRPGQSIYREEWDRPPQPRRG